VIKYGKGVSSLSDKMSAFLLIIPIILLRYGLLSLFGKEALKRAVFFAPLSNKEKTAYIVYQLATVLILICLIFVKINTDPVWFYAGLIIFCLGTVLYAASIINYAKPEKNGMNMEGLYRISRNPMYIAYFVYFLGCVFLTRSWVLLALIIAFQISSHWIILSEERWCIQQFGEEYLKYMKKVRRYL
jgi:protein-S-isoprenylcysteine O-methyltransferase Ste14